MNLNEWAIAWRIPYEALEDLRRRFGAITDTIPAPIAGASEAANQSRIRVEASEKHTRLWRNNVGATPARCPDCGQARQPIRYGLCNDSAQQNRRLKSSDLIGIRPVRITPAMVGQVLGQFVAREVKPTGWQYVGNEHEAAQLAFLTLVLALGGDAAFASGEGTILPGEPGLIDTEGN